MYLSIRIVIETLYILFSACHVLKLLSSSSVDLSRPRGVLVSYAHENGSCCEQGIVHRAYHVLEEYTVLLRDGSKEEVRLGSEVMKVTIWGFNPVVVIKEEGN